MDFLHSRMSASKLSICRNRYVSSRASLGPSEVVLELQGKPSLAVNSMWLRDHCRAQDRYNYQTNQRAVDLKTSSLDVEPINVDVENENLIVNWKDGKTSRYDISWIGQNYQSKPSEPPRLWAKSEQEEILLNSQVTWQDFTKSDSGVNKLLSSLLKYDMYLDSRNSTFCSSLTPTGME